jgi:hypothetical protein
MKLTGLIIDAAVILLMVVTALINWKTIKKEF